LVLAVLFGQIASGLPVGSSISTIEDKYSGSNLKASNAISELNLVEEAVQEAVEEAAVVEGPKTTQSTPWFKSIRDRLPRWSFSSIADAVKSTYAAIAEKNAAAAAAGHTNYPRVYTMRQPF
jgi:hypothetical protein